MRSSEVCMALRLVRLATVWLLVARTGAQRLICMHDSDEHLTCDVDWMSDYSANGPDLVSYSMVGSCPNSKDEWYRRNCELASVAWIQRTSQTNRSPIYLIPVVSERGRLYANVFCAICNDEVSWYVWPFRSTCTTNGLMVSEALTSSHPNLQDLLHDCQSPQLYVPKQLLNQGWPPCTSDARNDYAGLLRSKRGAGADSKTKRDIFSHFDSFSIVLSFGFNGMTSINVGPATQPIMRCKSDQVYDPASASCKQVYCPIGTAEENCKELEIVEEVDPSYTVTNTTKLCMINMRVKLSKKLYDQILPYLQQIDQIFAEMLGLPADTIIVDVFITHKEFSSSCSNATRLEIGALFNWTRTCIVTFQATFVAYIPDCPLVDKMCSFIIGLGNGESSINWMNRTVTIGNTTFDIPLRNRTGGNDTTPNKYTVEHENGVQEATLVKIDENYCYRMNPVKSSWLQAYTYLAPRFYVLTKSNYKYATMNISYTKESDSGNKTHYQYEHLLYLSPKNRVYKESEFEFVLQVAFKQHAKKMEGESVGYAIVCEYQLANCTRLAYKATELTWGPNKSVRIGDLSYNSTSYIWLNMEEIAICVDLSQYKSHKYYFCYRDSFAYLFFWSVIAMISYQLNMLSVCCSATVIFTYTVLSDLHNLPGYNMINLSFASIISKLIFTYGSGDQVVKNAQLCIAMAALLHYFLLTELLWMTVIGWHAYDVFVRRSNRFDRVHVSKRLLIYCLFGWGLPAIWVGICLTIDLVPALYEIFGRFYYGVVPPDDSGSADAVPESCWINDYEKSFYIYGIPLCVIVLINFTLFFLTCRSIRRAAKAKRRLSTGSPFANDNSNNASNHHNWSARDVQIFGRLSLATGVAWVSAIVFIAVEGLSSTMNTNPSSGLCVILWIAEFFFVIAQGSLGILQFYAFVWSPRIFHLYAAKLRSCYNAVIPIWRKHWRKKVVLRSEINTIALTNLPAAQDSFDATAELAGENKQEHTFQGAVQVHQSDSEQNDYTSIAGPHLDTCGNQEIPSIYPRFAVANSSFDDADDVWSDPS